MPQLIFFWILNSMPVTELYISHALFLAALEGSFAPSKRLVRSLRPLARAGTEVWFVWIQTTYECNNEY